MTAPFAGPVGARFCVTCGATRDPQSKFCTGCGAPAADADGDSAAHPGSLPAPVAAPPSWDDPRWDTPQLADAAWTGGTTSAADAPPPVSRLTTRPTGDAPWERDDQDHGRSRTPLVLLALVLAAAAAGGGYLLSRPDSTPSKAAAPTDASNPAPSHDSTGPSPAGPADPSTAPTDPALPPPTGVSRDLGSALAVTVPSQSKDNIDDAKNQVSYPASNMTDGDPTTCWRMDGDGAGQELTITIPSGTRITSVGLINGYAKVDPSSGTDRYRQERRITLVTWRFPDGTTLDQPLDPSNPSVQRMPVPNAPEAGQIVLRIDATSTPGDSNFNKTAISTIEIEGQ